MRTLFFNILYYLGIGRILKVLTGNTKKVPILLFHRVHPDINPFWPPLHPDHFEMIIKYIVKHYNVISVKELLSNEHKEFINCCCIVFDDAFKDFNDYALPILNKYNVPVTMFVPVECVDHGVPVWTTQLDTCFRFTEQAELTIQVEEKTCFFDISTLNNRINAAIHIQKRLLKCNVGERNRILKDIKLKLDYKPEKEVSVMSWDEIKNMQALVDFQSHTMSHPYLPSIEDEQLKYELFRSKDIVSDRLGDNIEFISYPNGGYNDKVLETAAEKYTAAFAVNNKPVDIDQLRNDKNYLFKIPRFNITDTNVHELYLRINGFHRLLGR